MHERGGCAISHSSTIRDVAAQGTNGAATSIATSDVSGRGARGRRGLGWTPPPQPKKLLSGLSQMDASWLKKSKQIMIRAGINESEMVEALNYRASPLRRCRLTQLEFGKRQPSGLLILAWTRLAEVSTEVLIDDKCHCQIE